MSLPSFVIKSNLKTKRQAEMASNEQVIYFVLYSATFHIYFLHFNTSISTQLCTLPKQACYLGDYL